ncbi:MAG: 2-amino-4-hydroxy-6-hydroxymethyldihydropteridine diphosphokinase [Porticoccaceae bacterium]|jgi:2-amino-4-hydroxy-6-hydroxymethyldihydropteridine diphosphokinase
MAEAFIGLGSNLSGESQGTHRDPKQQIHYALKKISQHPEITILGISSLYQTTAIGPGNQPDYINAAAMIETSLEPNVLLDFMQLIEHQQGRVREQRWGARTLDLDLLIYDQLMKSTTRLTLPHPRAYERAFVLAPLADLDADLIIPNYGKVTDLLANCSMQGIVRLSN